MRKMKFFFVVGLIFILSTTMAFADTEAEFIKMLTRENMTAQEMLKLSNDNLLKLSTYKFKGTNKMTTHTQAEGEDIAMKFNMIQEGFVKNPQEVYVKTSMVSPDETMPNAGSEVYMKDNVMYMKTNFSDKWTSIDMNPMMKKLQSAMGTNNSSNGIVSNEQLEAFSDTAIFDADEDIDGKKYYVISMNVSKETYKEIMGKFMENFSKTFGDMIMNDPNSEKSEEERAKEKAEFETAMITMLNNMDISISYKFYINPETKMYEKFEVKQDLNMAVQETTVTTSSEGVFNYYDLNGPVEFPTITLEQE
ncbi:DUF6612 family protein [Anaeromicrobium sediminis]|uniref:Uncharacterized protein n=1 Tax=Anaeromicrobium sediminis TaxID=1478221 RepID=A0A267MJ81_9FIRM|nr:DUF6612 family protein [Anaeromicrobium sediminis]PAB59507.1 hypothetical protein CCE28_09845 [Anaeromicrobium sediminis]